MTLTRDDKYRLYTPLEAISPLLIEATLLQEDQYFFQHCGCNPAALLRALWQTYVRKNRPIGASTITMQLARLCYGINSKTLWGKTWQIGKALQLELFYSKAEILEAYLNLASYGGNVEGIGAASAIYFDKTPAQLSLIEDLRLCVVPQNPKRRIPTSADQEAAKGACQRLFLRWLERHPDDAVHAHLIDLPRPPSRKHLPFYAPHFVDRILREDSGAVTTLNLTLQKIVENTLSQYVKQQCHSINNAAALLVDATNMSNTYLLRKYE